MGWASDHIRRLQAGETVRFRPRGNSMSGRIEHGQLVTVEPTLPGEVVEGDIVLCKVGSAEYLHLVKETKAHGCFIGNNRGHVNGWTPWHNIYGKCVAVGP